MNKDKVKENLIRSVIKLEQCWGHHDDGSELMVNQRELFNIMYNKVPRLLREALEEFATVDENDFKEMELLENDNKQLKWERDNLTDWLIKTRNHKDRCDPEGWGSCTCGLTNEEGLYLSDKEKQ